MSAFQNRSKASLRASLIDWTLRNHATTAISQRDGQSNRFITVQHVWELKRAHLQKQLYIQDLYSWIAFIFSRHAVSWCCSANHCWLACVLCRRYCSVSSQSFVISHLAIATVRNSEKQFRYFIGVSLPFSAECLAQFSLKAVSSLDS